MNVGGQYYCTSIETLRRFPQSMLGLMFSGRYPTAKDMDGKYFIDRDGPAFGVILNFLRTDRVFLGTVEPSLVYAEAEYYRLPLVPEWEVDVEVQISKGRRASCRC
uniref:Potassium channel tetramerisation-type BTB domain-containing protein n=1 Tax=Arcella intermedia TaxID=1963864 RepID=A0A6B2LTU5_9EUKA